MFSLPLSPSLTLAFGLSLSFAPSLSNPLIETLTRHFSKIISSTRYRQLRQLWQVKSAASSARQSSSKCKPAVGTVGAVSWCTLERQSERGGQSRDGRRGKYSHFTLISPIVNPFGWRLFWGGLALLLLLHLAIRARQVVAVVVAGAACKVQAARNNCIVM